MCVYIYIYMYILKLPATTSSYQPGSIPITSEAITGSRAASPVIHYQQTWLLGVKPTMGPERGPAGPSIAGLSRIEFLEKRRSRGFFLPQSKGVLQIRHIDPKEEYKTRASAITRDWAT